MRTRRIDRAGLQPEVAAQREVFDTAQSCDVVVLHAVWLCLATERECLAVLHEISCLLRRDGQFIATVTHPCFREHEFSTFHTDFRDQNYLADGTKFAVHIEDGTTSVKLGDTHWSLSAMSVQMATAGFVIRELAEIPDSAKGRSRRLGVPPWLVVFAEKR